MRLLELKLFLFLLFSSSNGIEFKLKQPKPDEYRCAYKKYIGENEGEYIYKLKESATACLDELPSPNDAEIEGEWSQKSLCEIVFSKNDDELRPEACNNEWIQPLAKKCRKTCGTCCELPEFKCNDKETIECNEIGGILAKRHSVNLWFPILLDHCPSAAGLCNELKKKEEEEKEKMKKKEEEEMNKSEWMIPIEEDCRDKKSESYCASKISSCNQNIILRRCRKTCGDCLPENFKCKNKEKHKRRCKLWAGNGFCRRDGKNKFTLGVILKYCPLTCGLCKNEEKEERKKRKEKKRKEEEKLMNLLEDPNKNCANDIFSLLLMANFVRAAENAEHGINIEDLQLISEHLENLVKNWFKSQRKGKIIQFYEKNVDGKLNVILRGKTNSSSSTEKSSETDWSSSTEKSSRSNSSSTQISDENFEFSAEKHSKEEMTMENVEFNVKMSVKKALDFLAIVNAFRKYYLTHELVHSNSNLDKIFKKHLVTGKEKWLEQIYEELKLSAEKAFKFLKLYEKNVSEVNFFFELIMLGASTEIGKEIIEQGEKHPKLKTEIEEEYGPNLKDEFVKFLKFVEGNALHGAEHLAEHKFDTKIWENFKMNVLEGKFNVEIVEGEKEIVEVKIERGEGNRQMSAETKELFDKVDWNKRIVHSDNSSPKALDDFNLKNSELPNVDMKIPVRLNPIRLSRLLKGLVKLEEKILEKWEKEKKEKKAPNLCKILHPKEENDRKGETVYPAFKTLLDLLSAPGYHDLDHGFGLIEVTMEREKELEIVPNKEDKRSTKNCKVDLAKIRAFMELAMSIHYSIDYQTINDNGAMARQIICENVKEYCDYPERIETYRIGYGKVIRVLDIWLDKIAEWANFAKKHIEMRFLVQILGTPPPRFDNQIGKNVAEYNHYPDHFLHPHFGLQKYCQHIIGVGKGEIENLSGYNFPALFFFSPIPELNGAAQFAQNLGSFDFEWSLEDAKTFYDPMEMIRKKMMNPDYEKTDLCRMLEFHAGTPVKEILKLKIVEEDFKYLRGAVKMYLHLPDYKRKSDGTCKDPDPNVCCIYDAIILQGAIQIVQNMLEVMKNHQHIMAAMLGYNQKHDVPELMKNYNEMTKRIQEGLAKKSKDKFEPKAWDLMSAQLIWGKFHVIFQQIQMNLYYPNYGAKVNLNKKQEMAGKERPISFAKLLPNKLPSAHSNEDKSAKSKEKKVRFEEASDDVGGDKGIVLKWKYKDAVDFFIIAEELKKEFVKKFEGKKKADLCSFLHEKASVEFWALLKYEKLEGMFKKLREKAKEKIGLEKNYQQPEDADDLTEHPDNCIYDFTIWRASIKIIENLSEQSKTKKDIEKRIFNGRGRTGGCEIEKYEAQSEAIKTWMKEIGTTWMKGMDEEKKKKMWKQFQSEWIMKIHLNLEDAEGTAAGDDYHKNGNNQKKKRWGKGQGGGGRRGGGRGGRNRNWNRDNPNWGPYGGYNQMPGMPYGSFPQVGIPPHQPKPMQPTPANAPQPQLVPVKPPMPQIPPVTHTVVQPNGQFTTLKIHRDGRGLTQKDAGMLPDGSTFFNRYIQRDGPNILPMPSPIGRPYHQPYVPTPHARSNWSMNHPLYGRPAGFGAVAF